MIEQVEILSAAQAENWDNYEGKALEEEVEFKERAEYKQYVSQVSAAQNAVNAAQNAVNAAQKTLEEEERKGAALRQQAAAKQKELRDKRLFKQLNLLDSI